ncbi:MAG: hypothetical protein ACRDOL_37555, partial [Streptosporangiaceae bacterium]
AAGRPGLGRAAARLGLRGRSRRPGPRRVGVAAAVAGELQAQAEEAVQDGAVGAVRAAGRVGVAAGRAGAVRVTGGAGAVRAAGGAVTVRAPGRRGTRRGTRPGRR